MELLVEYVVDEKNEVKWFDDAAQLRRLSHRQVETPRLASLFCTSKFISAPSTLPLWVSYATGQWSSR